MILTTLHLNVRVSFSGDNSNGKSINLAGITGGTLFASFTDCTNFGIVEHKPANSGGGNINIGGFIGHHNQEASQLGTITNCANKGNLINNGVATSELHMGGFIGYMQQASSTISGFINYGDITNNKEVSSWCCLGGVVGLIKDLKENANTIIIDDFNESKDDAAQLPGNVPADDLP